MKIRCRTGQSTDVWRLSGRGILISVCHTEKSCNLSMNYEKKAFLWSFLTSLSFFANFQSENRWLSKISFWSDRWYVGKRRIVRCGTTIFKTPKGNVDIRMPWKISSSLIVQVCRWCWSRFLWRWADSGTIIETTHCLSVHYFALRNVCSRAKSNLQKHGVQIPDRVAIACISGTDLCVLVHPSITAVRQPIKTNGGRNIRLIVQKVEHRNYLIKPL